MTGGVAPPLLAIAGLPASAWLLILAAGGIGLAIELVFYFRHRSRWSGSDRRGEGAAR